MRINIEQRSATINTLLMRNDVFGAKNVGEQGYVNVNTAN